MKKLLLIAAMAVFGLSNAQEGFKVGAHVGLPTGDAGDVFSFNVGVDAAYLWNMGDGFDLGVATGYSHFFGKTVSGSAYGVSYSNDVDDWGYIPVAVSGKYKLSGSQFYLGADLGYGIATKGDGGFYYSPRVGYNLSSGELYLTYKGVSNNGSINAIGLGYNFQLK